MPTPLPVLDAGGPLGSLGATSALGALAIGASGGAHCFMMCGPLACAATGAQDSRGRAILAHQGSRVAAYTLAGGIAGALGSELARLSPFDLRPALPWVVVAGLLVAALDLTRRLPDLPFAGRVLRAAAARARRLPVYLRASLLGAVSPLLPCGLSASALLVAAASGSLLGGLVTMALFALASAPGLLLAQLPLGFVRPDSRLALVLRRALPAAAAAVIVWRTLAASAGPAAQSCH